MPYVPPTGKVTTTPKRRADKKASDAALVADSTPATKTAFGLVKQSALIPTIAGASPTKAEWDALMAALKAAGLMATS